MIVQENCLFLKGNYGGLIDLQTATHVSNWLQSKVCMVVSRSHLFTDRMLVSRAGY